MTSGSAPDSACGGCTACCYELEIPDLDKPAEQLCPKARLGFGCSVYDESQPFECSIWKCAWLLERESRPDFPLELRPDQSHVLVVPNITGIAHQAIVNREHPDAWREPAMLAWLWALEQRGKFRAAGFGIATRTLVQIGKPTERAGHYLLEPLPEPDVALAEPT